MKEFLAKIVAGYMEFVEKSNALDLFFIILLSVIVVVYIIGLVVVFTSSIAKFNKGLAACNDQFNQIKMVDKTNRRNFYGVLNQAPIPIKKSWENYEYFKTGRAIDYFNKSSILESTKGFGLGKSMFAMFNLICPLIMFLLAFAVPIVGVAYAGLYAAIIIAFEVVLYSISVFIRRTQKKKASVMLDYFLEQLNVKANIYADIERAKIITVLGDDKPNTELVTSSISNVSIADNSKVLNDSLVGKAISNKGLSKNEKQAIANSIKNQKQVNQEVTNKKVEQSTLIKEKAEAVAPSSAHSIVNVDGSVIDTVLSEISIMKANGGSMKDIQRLIEVLHHEKEKPNKNDAEKQKLNLALNELLQILSNEKKKSGN